METMNFNATERAKNGKKLPTNKQKKFAREYIKTLNGTQSALKVYNTKDSHSAQLIGSENLSKPVIQREIVRLMEEKGLTDDLLLKKHYQGLDANKLSEHGEIEDMPTRYKYLELAYKLKGYTEAEKSNGNTQIAIIIEK